MPSLIDLRRRIRAVKSTQQITKAMKMIAASRLRRAQDRVVNARPFATDMLRVLNDVAERVEPDTHPLLDQRPAGGKILFVVITADRGLCGSFNSNIIKNAGQFIMAHDPGAIALGLVGRKGRDFFSRRGFEVKFEHVNIFQRVSYNDARAIARAATEDFTSRAVDQVYLIYNEFKSVLSQRVVIERLLPIPRLADRPAEPAEGEAAPVEFLFEPGPEAVFEELLPRHVEIQAWRALLESNAAFFAAQMTAMDTATKNSAEMIDQLTLYMNKLRQAAITREIIEVVSGAQAL
ncbi:MAG: ATP synthase F1 subunit gamma [Acidobacteria bacterium]|nr:ATP synthase F1 subunit gamma [Acidobacteriota bacterium]